HALTVVVAGAQTSGMKSEGFCYGRDLRAGVGEQRQVGVHVVGLSTVDANELIDNLGGVGCRKNGPARSACRMISLVGPGPAWEPCRTATVSSGIGRTIA
ncbi:MAG TPA: hypothetical protein VLU24_00060, partial [Mycobacterium sp.]|nr:hypothetical protein [Mycobacterium sp.]